MKPQHKGPWNLPKGSRGCAKLTVISPELEPFTRYGMIHSLLSMVNIWSAMLLSYVGGVNVFGEAIPLVPYVNIEAIMAADPQVIIASGQ